MLAHLRALTTRQDAKGRWLYKVQLVKGLYQRGWTPEDVRQLVRVIDWLLNLPPELEQAFQDDIHEWEEQNRMPYVTSFERLGMAKGLKQGRKEGLQDAIATALARKFGAAGKRLMSRVRDIDEVDQLRTLFDIVFAADSLKEIRDRLPARRG